MATAAASAGGAGCRCFCWWCPGSSGSGCGRHRSVSLRRKSFHEKFRETLRTFVTFLFSQLGLLTLVIAYSIAGAYLFRWLEAERELVQRRRLHFSRTQCIRQLWKLSNPGGGGGGNDSESHGWMVAAGSILREFEAELVMATKQDGYDGYDFDDEVDQHVRWSFSGALLFSITVITTIGTLITADAIFLIFTSILVCWSLLPPIFVDAQTIHNCYGNLTPKTALGKMVTCLYALIGIPLMLLCLSNLGQLMAASLQFAFNRFYCCTCYCPSSSSASSSSSSAITIGGGGGGGNQRQSATAADDGICSKCFCCKRSSSSDAAETVAIVVPSPPPLLTASSSIDHRNTNLTAAFTATKQMNNKVLDEVEDCGDYDVVIIQMSPSNEEPSFKGGGGGGGGVHQFYNGRHYGLERLDRVANGVVDNCSRYENNNQQGVVGINISTSFSDAAVATDQLLKKRKQKARLQWTTALASLMTKKGSSSSPAASTAEEDVGSECQQQQTTSARINSNSSSRRQEQPQQPQQQRERERNKGQRVPVLFVLVFLVGYICLGAVVFSAWEEWSFLDGAYFSFITLSTIGFGDLVPGSKVLEQGQYKLVTCVLYLFFGLAVIAMSFNLVQEEVVSCIEKLGQNMGILDEK